MLKRLQALETNQVWQTDSKTNRYPTTPKDVHFALTENIFSSLRLYSHADKLIGGLTLTIFC